MTKVVLLFRAPKRRVEMEELLEREVENAGFEGCADARPGGNGKFCWWTATRCAFELKH